MSSLSGRSQSARFPSFKLLRWQFCNVLSSVVAQCSTEDCQSLRTWLSFELPLPHRRHACALLRSKPLTFQNLVNPFITLKRQHTPPHCPQRHHTMATWASRKGRRFNLGHTVTLYSAPSSLSSQASAKESCKSE